MLFVLNDFFSNIHWYVLLLYFSLIWNIYYIHMSTYIYIHKKKRKNISETLKGNIEQQIKETIENNLGYSMIYNIVENIRVKNINIVIII
ncbi:hypothetical protein [Plasmodium yoelii yoelii]|uniref:Uncharacterized protein n=1 Tax=Plasmodium yoelii yoelii TaxID=73239 RepID=Q7RL65_PLAYO|nr:hypothetical protein [Plasmodium yoelii yoelii]